MSRKSELLKVFENVDESKDVILPLIDDVVFLEDRLDELRKLPFIRVNPKDPSQQKSTPASKLYRELLQQYNQCNFFQRVLVRNGVIDKLRAAGVKEGDTVSIYDFEFDFVY